MSVRFGEYGGMYIPETLMNAVLELNEAYERFKDDPEFISQRKAYELFGRRNVERWKRQGKVVSYKRPGKVEYRTADLRLLQRTTQDYFDESQPKQAEKPVKKDK